MLPAFAQAITVERYAEELGGLISGHHVRASERPSVGPGREKPDLTEDDAMELAYVELRAQRRDLPG